MAQMPFYDILNRSGNKEILLLQAQTLSLRVVIRGIEDFADDLRHCRLLHSLHVLTLVKKVHIERGRLAFPKAQNAVALSAVAGNKHIVRNACDSGIARNFNRVVLIIPAVNNLTAEADLNGLLLARNEPDLAAGEPEIGQLGLPAVNKLLSENSAFIKNAVAHAVIALSCKAVQIARRKAAETAVSETGVRLAVIKLFKTYIKILERRSKGVRKAEIEKIILERATHEELHAEVVDFFGIGLLRLFAEFAHALMHKLADDESNRFIILLIGSFLNTDAEIMGKLSRNKLLCLSLCERVFHTKPPK